MIVWVSEFLLFYQHSLSQVIFELKWLLEVNNLKQKSSSVSLDSAIDLTNVAEMSVGNNILSRDSTWKYFSGNYDLAVSVKPC